MGQKVLNCGGVAACWPMCCDISLWHGEEAGKQYFYQSCSRSCLTLKAFYNFRDVLLSNHVILLHFFNIFNTWHVSQRMAFYSITRPPQSNHYYPAYAEHSSFIGSLLHVGQQGPAQRYYRASFLTYSSSCHSRLEPLHHLTIEEAGIWPRADDVV